MTKLKWNWCLSYYIFTTSYQKHHFCLKIEGKEREEIEYSKTFQITVEFDQVMMKENLTDFDMSIDISGPNSPYSISWSSNFDKKNLIISFSSSPVLLGCIGEIIRLQLIDVRKFKSEHNISMLASKELKSGDWNMKALLLKKILIYFIIV